MEQDEKITKKAHAGRGQETKWEIPVNNGEMGRVAEGDGLLIQKRTFSAFGYVWLCLRNARQH